MPSEDPEEPSRRTRSYLRHPLQKERAFLSSAPSASTPTLPLLGGVQTRGRFRSGTMATQNAGPPRVSDLIRGSRPAPTSPPRARVRQADGARRAALLPSVPWPPCTGGNFGLESESLEQEQLSLVTSVTFSASLPAAGPSCRHLISPVLSS